MLCRDPIKTTPYLSLQNHENETKKRKLSRDTESDTERDEPQSKMSLSALEKTKIEQNKLAAKLKLLSSKTNGLAVNVGSTWLRALEPEFSKNYFSQVKNNI